MAINLTDSLNAATTKGKIASAKQVYLDGDQENLQQVGERTHQMEQAIKDIGVSGGASIASAVSYDNKTSGMTSVTVQGAIDELTAKDKSQDNEIAKKANSSDVNSQMKTEQTRVNTELDKKFNKENVAQELGNAKDKVFSQNVVNSLLQINIENSLSGLYNNISFDGNTLTIKKEGFSVICMGKRITFSGSEDKVYKGTGVRTSLYLNPKYLVDNSPVDFTTNDDVFVLKQDTVYNGILFAQWYQSKLMVTGLIAAILINKQLSNTNDTLSDTNDTLSDTNDTLSDTNKIQIYCLNNGYPYIEETEKDKVYIDVKQLGIRSNNYTATYTQEQLLAAMGVKGVTSPNGIENCLEISSLECFVYNLSDRKLEVINRYEITPKHIVLLSNVSGKVALTKNSSIYNQWVDSQINKQLSDINKQLSDTNKIQIYIAEKGVPYLEETTDGSISVYFHSNGAFCVRGFIDKTVYQDQLIEELGIEGVTSPNGKTSCIKIDNMYNLVFDISDSVFKIVHRNKITSSQIVLIASLNGKFDIRSSSLINQWIIKQLSDTNDTLSDISQNVDTNKESNIINNVAQNSDFKFMFYSDVHGSANNVQRILDKSKALGTSYVDCILNGGDTVQNFNSEGLSWYNGLYEKAPIPMLTAVGNHDAWSNNYWVWDTTENIYNLVTKKVKEYVPSIVQPSDVDTSFASYYYYDTDKVRIIVLLSLKPGSVDIFYDNTQNEWLKSVLADAKTNDKAVIIMNHGPIDPKDSEELESNWSSKLTWTEDLRDTQHFDDKILTCVDDFINDGGTFICYLAGHSHVDYLLRSKSHPKQMCLVIASARYNYAGDCYKSGKKTNKDYDLYNYIGVDLTHSVIKVMRIGCNNNAWMQEHNTLCIDFKNCKILAEH